MKFSQQQEKTADLWALDLLNRRYGHVSGVTDFFEKMSKKNKNGRIAYYFATHPYPQDRVKTLEEKIQRKGYFRKEKIPLDDALRDISQLTPVSR
jgi:predicted Zn-dependent protease